MLNKFIVDEISKCKLPLDNRDIHIKSRISNNGDIFNTDINIIVNDSCIRVVGTVTDRSFLNNAVRTGLCIFRYTFDQFGNITIEANHSIDDHNKKISLVDIIEGIQIRLEAAVVGINVVDDFYCDGLDDTVKAPYINRISNRVTIIE